MFTLRILKQGYCAHCERITAWRDHADHYRCSTCHREPADVPISPRPDRGPAQPPRRAARVKQQMRTYLPYLNLILLLVFSVILAAYLDGLT